MTVTKLTQSQKIPGRWYLALENGETLKVSIAQIADFSLFTGRELNDVELEALRKSASCSNAKARALRIIGTRQMSRREITSRLVQKGETPENAQEATEYLERIGAVNDTEYADSIVRHYSQRCYGTGRIRSELSRHGIPQELWEDALCQLPNNTGALDKFIENRLQGGTPDKKELKKLTDALLRRGFSWDEIKEALERNRAAEDFD